MFGIARLDLLAFPRPESFCHDYFFKKKVWFDSWSSYWEIDGHSRNSVCYIGSNLSNSLQISPNTYAPKFQIVLKLSGRFSTWPLRNPGGTSELNICQNRCWGKSFLWPPARFLSKSLQICGKSTFRAVRVILRLRNCIGKSKRYQCSHHIAGEYTRLIHIE